MFESIVKVCVSISAIAGAGYSLYKFYYWMFPLRIEPSCKICFGDSGLDSISATIVNQSTQTLYIVKCFARGVNSRRYILGRHLRRPFIRPALYPNIWYGGVVYSLMSDEPIKLEPRQQITLAQEIAEHPLNAMFTPYFKVKVVLSSGREFWSKRMRAPARWKMIGRNSREFA